MMFQPVSTSGSNRRDAIAERLQRREFIGAARGAFRHGPIAAVDDQHFVDARREQGDRQQTLAFGVGLDVERQHPRLDRDVGGP